MDIFHKFLPKWQDKEIKHPSESYSDRLRRWVGKPKALPLEINDLSYNQVIIALMGPTGAGKSSFIATAIGSEAGDGFNIGVGHDLESCTTEVKMVKHECPYRSDLDVVFVDTPGSDCTELTDAQVLKMIEGWVSNTYQRKIVLAGILYFHRISDNRATVTPLTNLGMFKKLCGENSLQNIIMATTMWDDVEQYVGAEREAELKATDWRAMVDQGSRVMRFNRTQESAWSILDRFVQDGNIRHARLLQEELAEMKKQLPRTNPSQRAFIELETLIRTRQSILEKIREEISLHQDAARLGTLKAEYDDLQRQLAAAVSHVQTSKIPIGKHILRLI